MKNPVKYYLDFIPLLTVVLYTAFSIGTMINNENNLEWQHCFGIALLIIDIIILFKYHQLGIIIFGFILLLGLLTLVSFDVGIVTNTLHLTAAEIPVFWGNAMCLLWLIIHLIFSFRYYVGIATKEYWKKLFKEIKHM